MDNIMSAVSTILEEISEEDCAFCSSSGDTLPCLVCDVFVCGECGVGVRWCKQCWEKSVYAKEITQ